LGTEAGKQPTEEGVPLVAVERSFSNELTRERYEAAERRKGRSFTRESPRRKGRRSVLLWH